MIEEDEVLKLIRDKLEIYISDTTEWGPVRRISVELVLDNEVISESNFDIEIE